MKRVKRRRYGRDNAVVASVGATHAIKIGFNRGGDGKVLPGKLNGFLIFRDTLGNDNKLLIDYRAMERLGYSAEQISRAMKAGFTGDPADLPQQLRFVLMADATKTDDGAWNYPSTYSASFECYGKMGLFCRGDGNSAQRKQDDGSLRTVPCIPYGASGADPADFCEFSGPEKPCKMHFRLVVCLYYIDPNGQRQLVSPELGMQARFRFDSSSDYMDAGVLDALDAAADRVQGRLNGITGTLTFQKKGRRTGNEKFSKSITGFVYFVLDEESIRAREMQLAGEEDRRWERQIEAQRAQLQIEAPAQVTHGADAFATEAKPVDVPVTQPAAPVETERAEPGPDPEPEIINADEPAEITDQDLAYSLASYLRSISETEDQFLDHLNDLAFGHPDGFINPRTKKREQIEDADWFLGGETDAKKEKRREMLRAICERLEGDETKGFTVEVQE